VQHGVDGQWQPQRTNRLGHRELAIMRAPTGHGVGRRRLGVLKGQLQVVQTRVSERGQPRLGQAHPTGDQVDVHAQLVRAFDQRHKVAAQRRLAAGQVHLQHARLAGLPEHAQPRRSVEFVPIVTEVERIGTVRALQRTSVGQFGQQAERCRHSRRDAGRSAGTPDRGDRGRPGRDHSPGRQVGEQGVDTFDSGVAGAQIRDDLVGRPPRVAPLDDRRRRLVEEQNSFGIKENRPASDQVVGQPDAAP
jgi:hypothetical protein